MLWGLPIPTLQRDVLGAPAAGREWRAAPTLPPAQPSSCFLEVTTNGSFHSQGCGSGFRRLCLAGLTSILIQIKLSLKHAPVEWNFLLNKVLLTQLPAPWAQAELSSAEAAPS